MEKSSHVALSIVTMVSNRTVGTLSVWELIPKIKYILIKKIRSTPIESNKNSSKSTTG